MATLAEVKANISAAIDSVPKKDPPIDDGAAWYVQGIRQGEVLALEELDKLDEGGGNGD
jgi:hypothetical protein